MRARRVLGAAAAPAMAAAILLSAAPSAHPAAATPPGTVEQRYEIVATLDVASGRLEAVLDLQLTNRSRWPLDKVDLSFVPLALGFASIEEPVLVADQPAAIGRISSISLSVPLDGLAPGAATVVRVPFRLDVGPAPPAFTARTSRDDGVLSFGQWFPIVSLGHEIHGLGDSQISFTAERIRLDLTTTSPMGRDAVACPGLVVAPEREGTRWTCEVDQVRDLSFVVNPGFRLTSRQADGVALRVYTETVDGGRTADLAAQALVGMAERFGPYPWPDLVLAEVGSASGFSMEYPRQVHLTRDKVADPYVVMHEVAHQWFYAQVGSDQQAEPWLDEAFSDFSARLLMGIGENACGTRPVDSPVFAWPADAVTGGDWTSCDGYFHSVFYRGTRFLNAVREAVGNDTFFAAMRAWIEEHRHGFVTGRELLWHLDRRADADLRPLYEQYLANPDPRPFRAAAGGAAATTVAAGVAAAD